MSEADNHDTRLAELLATDARADTAAFYRRLSREGLHRHYETVDEASALAIVAAQALAGDPDGALRRLESVPVRHLQELHAAVIELCAAQERSHAVFAVGGPGSIH